MAEPVYLTVGEVLEIHHQQIDHYRGVEGIRDKAPLESAVFRPKIGSYNTIAEEAAGLMESLANNRPFLDGNKRVAFAAAPTFRLINSFDLELRIATPGRIRVHDAGSLNGEVPVWTNSRVHQPSHSSWLNRLFL